MVNFLDSYIEQQTVDSRNKQEHLLKKQPVSRFTKSKNMHSQQGIRITKRVQIPANSTSI